MPLSHATVAVVGLGLMGGSLSLALRGKCSRIVGMARRSEVAQHALDGRVVDAASCDLHIVGEADIVVLATPVRHILSILPALAEIVRPGTLIIDLGSTKAQIVAAMNALPESIQAIGGHPMCGKETGGLESADANLYRGATFVLTPTERTTGDAMSEARELVESLGAHALILDAERHDKAVATISHLPYMLAASLVHVEATASGADDMVGKLAASGFRDTSRLAASSVDMMLDIVLTNRAPIEEALDMFEKQVAGVRHMLGDPEALKAWMYKARTVRREMYR